MTEFDVVIVGQGLAGSALAWRLREQGLNLLVIDQPRQTTASRVAAGLITPITGPRLVLYPRYLELLKGAEEFYRQVEAQAALGSPGSWASGGQLLESRRMLKLFVSAAERQLFERKRVELEPVVVREHPEIENNWYRADDGGFEMQGAQLRVSIYLDIVRMTLLAESRLLSAELTPESPIEFERGRVILSEFGLSAKWLIFCDGSWATTQRWFADAGFNLAKGEILTVDIPDWNESRVIHRGVWIAPTSTGLYHLGATYEWQELNDLPTEQGRAELLARLAEWFRGPVRVINQTAAVRPATRDSRPLIGFHPLRPQIGLFNGFGSRGSLLVPYYSTQFANALLNGHPIDAEVQVTRWNR
ncbi:MAG: FAD-binding oxidoreductase [Planctomycetaceae bacterium]